ncbi:hypothetical protein ACFE04_025459 [Oxalis oulophora]
MISNYFVIPSKSLPFLPANNITVYGDAYFTENSIGLTQERPTCISPPSSPLSSSIGRAFYVYPIRFLDQQSNTTASFTCRFSFSITPSRACPFGDGLAFLITSRTDSFSFSNGYFGLPLESFIAVEFDTSFDSAIGDINGNHVGVDVNTVISFAAIDAASKGVDLKSERKITAWIEYRDALKLIRVWVGYESTIRPSSPVLAAYVDLSNQFHEYMHVGFSASNGQGSAVHIVSHWQFKTFTTSSNSNDTPLDSVQEGDCLMCTPGDLVDFNDTVDDSKTIKLGNDGGSRLGVKGLTAIILSVVVVICIIIVILILRFCKIVCIKNNGSQDLSSSSSQMSSIPVRWPISEIRASTLGFHPSRIIGRGASAKVYRGSLASGELVAVKRFERKNQIDCVKNPFTTEFATMVGCLKHKNLVQLQGWCCEETELILVYEYLPNGSLDKLLHYKSHSAILLSWEQRLNILLGVGSALLYLHEECDRQIIHRDVKTCNIMIDAEYNAKLGDFGLAEMASSGSEGDPYRYHLYEEGEKNTQWRFGAPPNFDIVNKLFEQGRTKIWPPGSLEEKVQSLVKTFEMELFHKPRAEDYKTLDPNKLTIAVNGRKPRSLEEICEEGGSYNTFMQTSLPKNLRIYDPEEETIESAHTAFTTTFPRGFALEILQVYSGPPVIVYKFRHWGYNEGPFIGHPQTGDLVELYGIAIFELDEEGKIVKMEFFYDRGELLAGLSKGPILNEPSNSAGEAASCPFMRTTGLWIVDDPSLPNRQLLVEKNSKFSMYKSLIILLLLLETAIASDILLNSDWEKDLPKDPTGRFHDFEDFVDSNFDVFQWLIFFIIMAQIFSFLLALALRSANWDSNYHSDEDLQVRYPLINNHPIQPPPYVIGIPPYVSKTDAGPL